MMYNSFDEAATPLLFFKIDDHYHPILKAFLVYLDKLPDALNNNIDQKCIDLLFP